MARQMQAVLRVQARARAERGQISESSQSSSKSSHFHNPGPTTPEKSECSARVKSTKHDQSPILRRNGSKSSGNISYQDRLHLGRDRSEWRVNEGLCDLQRVSSTRNHLPEEEYGDKILEVDTIKPLYTPKRKNHFTAHQQMEPNRSASSGEVQSQTPLKFTDEIEESPFCTANNSPQFYSASSRGGSSRRSPFTPSKSDGSRSFLSGYSDHPNYMAYTESSRAKARSMSAPKQRPQFEKSSSMKRYSLYGSGESRSASQKLSSSLQASFMSKPYPGSGRLDKLGMPVVRGRDGLGYRYYG
ncbi:hypothetical protein CRG98_038182 [Punica granatum]|nr:hypothetical protein CRG98_038182 [Punica granatum]